MRQHIKSRFRFKRDRLFDVKYRLKIIQRGQMINTGLHDRR
jgi:hypothetical protein